jgi:hypothetical protein
VLKKATTVAIISILALGFMSPSLSLPLPLSFLPSSGHFNEQ